MRQCCSKVHAGTNIETISKHVRKRCFDIVDLPSTNKTAMTMPAFHGYRSYRIDKSYAEPWSFDRNRMHINNQE